MARVDTKTRYQGVYARHQLSCALGAGGKKCSCTPSYYGIVWDRVEHRQRKTARFRGAIEARDARADLLDSLRKGTVSRDSGMTLGEARTKFVKAAREGVVLNKWRRRYRRRRGRELGAPPSPTSPTTWLESGSAMCAEAKCRRWSIGWPSDSPALRVRGRRQRPALSLSLGAGARTCQPGPGAACPAAGD